MNVALPDAPAAKLTAPEARLALAVWLYQVERLSFGDACALAAIPLREFEAELSRRGIPLGYNLAELSSDVADLRALGHL